jgi:hypothetical protein
VERPSLVPLPASLFKLLIPRPIGAIRGPRVLRPRKYVLFQATVTLDTQREIVYCSATIRILASDDRSTVSSGT